MPNAPDMRPAAQRVITCEDPEILYHFDRFIGRAAALRSVPVHIDGDTAICGIIQEQLASLSELWDAVEAAQDTSLKTLCWLCSSGDLEPLRWMRWLAAAGVAVPYRCGFCGEVVPGREMKFLEGRRISSRVVPFLEKVKEAHDRFEDEVRSGFLQKQINVVAGDRPEITLSSGEFIRISLPAVLIRETTVRHSRSKQISSPTRYYSGVSMRIGRGSSIWLGQSHAAPRETVTTSYSVRKDENADSGSLAVTNRRVVFVGRSSAGLSIEGDQIAAVQRIDQGLMVVRKNRVTPVRVRFLDVGFTLCQVFRLIDAHPLGPPALFSIEDVLHEISATARAN